MNLDSVLALQRAVGEMAIAEGLSAIPRLQVGSVEFVVPGYADPGRVLKWLQERYRALPSFEMRLTRKGRQRRVKVVYRT